MKYILDRKETIRTIKSATKYDKTEGRNRHRTTEKKPHPPESTMFSYGKHSAEKRKSRSLKKGGKARKYD